MKSTDDNIAAILAKLNDTSVKKNEQDDKNRALIQT